MTAGGSGDSVGSMTAKKAALKPKPCPFCRDKAAEEVFSDPVFGFYVTCRNLRCFCRGPVRTTPRGAVKAWNMRSTKAVA